jgi:undecaprenyl-diphosphatase
VPTPRSRTATTILIVVAWGVILGAVLGVGWLLTHPLKSSVNPWDNDAARWFADHRSSSLHTPADVGTLLGETVVGMSVALVAAVAISWWQRSLVPAIFFALLTGGIGGIYFLGTHLYPRSRPPVRILDAGLAPDASFPSGHVATATAVYGGIVLLAWVFAPGSRRWVWALLAVPALVLLARLYQGAHHLTDVLTSVAYTAVWMFVLARLLLCHPVAHDSEETGSDGDGAADRPGRLRRR